MSSPGKKEYDRGGGSSFFPQEVATDFASGIFTPILREANDMVCDIEGSLPADLCGTYFRNGPNPQHPPKKDEPYHFFDGDGMIVSFQFLPRERKVIFNHKWVHTERFVSDKKLGKSVYEFGSMAVGTFPDYQYVVDKRGVRMGKANTALVFHNKKLYALEDADLPYHMELPSLKTVGKSDFCGTWKHNIFTAHPKLDPNTGELVGYGCAYGTDPVPTWHYSVISGSGECICNFPITLRNTSYTHDFAMTRSYSVCYDGNLILDFNALMNAARKTEDERLDMWEFNRNIPGRIGVFPRYAKSQEEVMWFDVEPFCVSHTANAWEEGNEVVIVVNCIGYEGFKPKFPKETPVDPDANLREYRLNLKTGESKETCLRRIRSDFPTINQKFTGCKTRYLYAQLIAYEEPNHAPYLYGAYKYDLHTRTYQETHWEEGKPGGRATCMGCEAFFVPKRPSNAEDDGYLLVIVNDIAAQRTELRVYDASSFGGADRPIAKIICPRRILPLGTHGLWLDEEDIRNSIPQSRPARSML
jgi:carotenoid cleavage dioxygenase